MDEKIKDSKMKSSLEKEIDAYMQLLPEMLKGHVGEWTVFNDEKCLGFWKNFEDALISAYKKVGYVALLAREVSKEYIEYGRYGKPAYIYIRSPKLYNPKFVYS